jgi:long-chain acyl-CoA synthetase
MNDLIISGGENIYPTEVESAIFGHPVVAEVVVVGVPDPVWGEAVKAVLVVKPGCKPDTTGILHYARERLAPYKVPKSIDYVDALPRNAAGKTLRRAVRDSYVKRLASADT